MRIVDSGRSKYHKPRSGNNCCAKNCFNRESKDKVSFYRIPKAVDTATKARRKAWLQKISRVGPDGKPWKPTKNSRLCSEHFISGRKSDDPKSPNYIPRIFSHRNVKKPKERRTRVSRRLFVQNGCEGQTDHDIAGNKAFPCMSLHSEVTALRLPQLLPSQTKGLQHGYMLPQV